MNQLDLKKIPKFIYVLLITIVVGVLFWIFVGQSLVKNAPKMIKEHEDNVVLITKYDNALAQEKAIEAEIKKNNEEYDRKQKELFVDLDTCSKEIEKYCKDNNIALTNYNLSEPVVDKLNRISSAGYPVYTVDINVAYQGTYDTTLDLLKYVEKTSKGCYYINSCSLQQVESSKDKFDVSVTFKLYYYDTTANVKPTQAATEAATKK